MTKRTLIYMTATLSGLLSLALVAIGGSRPASAATYVVDTFADSAALTACTGAANDCSLRGAIIAANATSSIPDTISLPAGTYAIGGTRDEDMAATGDLDIRCTTQSCSSGAPITINGLGAAPGATVIDAGGSDRVFDLALVSTTFATLNLTNLTVRNGNPGGANGGGIRSGTGDNVILTNVVFADNVTGGSGGGIANNGSMTIANSTISGNSAGSGGGGVLNAQPGVITIDATTINGNYAGSGGGLNNSSVQPSSATLTNVTISGNGASVNGGGIRNAGLGTAPISLTNVTLSGNTAPSGSGIYNDDSAGLKNTIMSNTAATNCGGTVPVTNNGGNLDSGATCGFASGNAALGPLANNGGPTYTHALQAGSQAINTGVNAGCPGTDQRGVARSDGACDIGAYEAGAAGPTPTQPPTPTPLPTPTPPPAPGSDNDGDGFTFSAEGSIGTGPADPCGNNGWPADLAGADNRLNIGDFNSFLFPLRANGSFNKFGHAVPDPMDPNIARWNIDIAGGPATINIGDLNALNPAVNAPTSRPPMFGGLPAFFTNGGLCPFPP